MSGKTPAKYNGKLVEALRDLVRESKWHHHAQIQVRVEEFYPPREQDGALKEISYELRGRVLAQQAAAEGCWTPDRLRDKCDEISDRFEDELVVCDCDFVVEASGVKVKDLLTADRTVRLVEPGQKNVLLCWTSFHSDTDDALRTLCHVFPKFSSSTTTSTKKKQPRIVGLVLDEQPFEARAKVRKLALPFENLWVGTGGWTSKAAKALSLEESSPTAYLFDKNGSYLMSGALEDVLIELQAGEAHSNDDDNDDVGDDKAKGPATSLIPSEAWTRVKSLVDEMKQSDEGAFRAVLRTVSTTSNGQTKMNQRIVLKGELYPEGRPRYFAFKRSFRLDFPSAQTNFGGVQHVTRPRPLNLTSTCCSACSKSVNSTDGKFYFGCLCCNVLLCDHCGASHEAKHPLVVLGVKQHDLGRSLYGIGHVVFLKESDDDDGSADPHPDLGCDCCLSTFGSSSSGAVRYKNLARTEHELCGKCFKESIEFRKNKSADFVETFNCEPSDPFCAMKTSRGVVFSRIDESFVEPKEEEEEEARDKPQQSATTMASPNGHTLYSWLGEPGDRSIVPFGHTEFSWRGVQ